MSKAAIVTAAQIEEMKNMVMKGMTNKEIAKQFNLHEVTVCQYVTSTRKEENKKRTEKMIYYREKRGFSNNAIATKMGCKYETVLRHIGKQPAEITKASYSLAGQMKSARHKARVYAAKQIELKKAELARLEAERLEQERIERERQEAERRARIEKAQAVVAQQAELQAQYENFIREADRFRMQLDSISMAATEANQYLMSQGVA